MSEQGKSETGMIFQKTPGSCQCSACGAGCLCGDCSGCTNVRSERGFIRGVKRAALLATIFLVIGGFMFFAPVVNLRSVAPVTTGVISIKIDTSETTTGSLCSIAYCYIGQGAVYAGGVYYPVTRPAVNGIHGDRAILVKHPNLGFMHAPLSTL